MIPDMAFDPGEDDAPEIPMRAGEPLSDPYARVQTKAHQGPYPLDAAGVALIRERYDGTRATAQRIGEKMGGVPAWQIISWASSMGLTNTIQPPHGHGRHQRVVKQDQDQDQDQDDVASEASEAKKLLYWQEKRSCEICGATYIPSTKTQLTCSRSCGMKRHMRDKNKAESDKSAADGTPSALRQESETLARMRKAWSPPLPAAAPAPCQEQRDELKPEPELEDAPVAEPLRVLMDTPETPDYRALFDLMDLLPDDGVWPRQRRDRWVRAYLAVLDVVIVTVEGMVS